MHTSPIAARIYPAGGLAANPLLPTNFYMSGTSF